MMNIKGLAIAAAIVLGSIGAAPAVAQPDPNHNGQMSHNGDRDRGDMRDDNGRHNGWRDNGNNGRHRGWRNHHRRQVCRTIWRHHHRQRVCTWR